MLKPSSQQGARSVLLIFKMFAMQNASKEPTMSIEDAYRQRQEKEDRITEQTQKDYSIAFSDLYRFQYYPLGFNSQKPNELNNMVTLIRMNLRDYGAFSKANASHWISRLATLIKKHEVNSRVAVEHFEKIFDARKLCSNDLIEANYYKQDTVRKLSNELAKDIPITVEGVMEDKWQTPVFKKEVFEKLPPFFKGCFYVV